MRHMAEEIIKTSSIQGTGHGSLHVIIPMKLVKRLNLKIGESVIWSVDNGDIIIRRIEAGKPISSNKHDILADVDQLKKDVAILLELQKKGKKK